MKPYSYFLENCYVTKSTLDQLIKNKVISFHHSGEETYICEKCFLKHYNEWSENHFSQGNNQRIMNDITNAFKKNHYAFHKTALFPLFLTTANEILELIVEPRLQEMLREFLSGKSEILIAQKYKITLDQLYKLFQDATKQLYEKSYLIKPLLQEIYTLKRENSIYKNRLQKAETKLQKINLLIAGEQTFKIIPPEIKQILNTQITPQNFNLTSRIFGTLKMAEITTIGDLLKFIKENKLSKIKMGRRNCGDKSINILKQELISKNLIDQNEQSPYFDYIE